MIEEDFRIGSAAVVGEQDSDECRTEFVINKLGQLDRPPVIMHRVEISHHLETPFTMFKTLGHDLIVAGANPPRQHLIGLVCERRIVRGSV
jgi:hypothetical protein